MDLTGLLVPGTLTASRAGQLMTAQVFRLQVSNENLTFRGPSTPPQAGSKAKPAVKEGVEDGGTPSHSSHLSMWNPECSPPPGTRVRAWAAAAGVPPGLRHGGGSPLGRRSGGPALRGRHGLRRSDTHPSELRCCRRRRRPVMNPPFNKWPGVVCTFARNCQRGQKWPQKRDQK